MVWTPLDDQYPHSIEMTELADIALLGFDVCGKIYCNRLLTDGFIPDSAMNQVYPPLRSPKKLAEKLVVAGLWERDDEAKGYRIIDFLDCFPSSEEVKAKRRKRSEAGRAGGKSGANGQANASADTEANASSETKRIVEPQPCLTPPSHTSPPPPRAYQLTLGGGGSELDQTRETLREQGIPDDVAEKAIRKARIRSADGEVRSFTAYALKRARTLMEERASKQAKSIDPARVRERATIEALNTGDLADCDHGSEMHTCPEPECIDLTEGILSNYSRRILERTAAE